MLRSAIVCLATLLAAGVTAAQESRPFAVVYPVIVRMANGTAFDRASRDLIAREVSKRLGVEVTTSDREVAFALPANQTQAAIFRAGLESMPKSLGDDLAKADYTIIIEYLIVRTRYGAERVAGIEGYLIDAGGKPVQAGVENTDDPAFRRANLTVRSTAEHPRLLERTTHHALGEIVKHLETLTGKNRKP